MMNKMLNPLSPRGSGDGGIIGKIIKAVKTIIDIFKKPSREAGQTDSINDNASLENIDRIFQIFSDFKEQVYAHATEIENAMSEEVDYYVEELHSILQDDSCKVEQYGIRVKKIEREIDKISSRMKGTVNNEISKRVSLDNAECKEVVKMIPGSKKEQAMEAFFKETVKKAVDKCCEELRSILEEIYEDTESEVVGAVEVIQKQNAVLQESFCSIDRDNYEETAKKQIINACYLEDVCDLVGQIL